MHETFLIRDCIMLHYVFKLLVDYFVVKDCVRANTRGRVPTLVPNRSSAAAPQFIGRFMSPPRMIVVAIVAPAYESSA